MDVAILIELEAVHGPNLIPELYKELVNKGHRVVACGLCQSRLGPYLGYHQGLYFLNTFGFFNTYLFFLAALLSYLKIRSLSVMAFYQKFFSENNIPVLYAPDPNQTSMTEFFKQFNPDVVISLQGWILKREMLTLPKFGVVNKHASLLPWQKGLLPFFWARLKGMDLGVSYHLMTERIDEGPILLQEKLTPPPDTSLFSFYLDIYRNCPAQLVQAIERLSDRLEVEKGQGGDYCSLPSRRDYQLFRFKGYRMVRLNDLKKMWVGA